MLRYIVARADYPWFTYGPWFAASQPASQPARGIPIGNLTSQFFANIYLNGLDHFIKEGLRCRYYLRYMDDFVVFHNDKAFLSHVREQIICYLRGLRLRLHENKCQVYAASSGVPFLGVIMFSDKRRLKRQTIVRFQKRMKRFQRLYPSGDVDWSHIHQSVQSWIGHAKHADTATLRNNILPHYVFERGDRS
jgi:RNA-directed DNA polymerase